MYVTDVQERQVVYYGAYANASRLRRSHKQSAEDSSDSVRIPFPEEPTPFEQPVQNLILDQSGRSPLANPYSFHPFLIRFIP